jgi:hypothetical protein
MRLVFALTLLSGTVALAQDPVAKEPEPRFGVAPKLKVYPQSTPKQALKSALTAIQSGDTAYLVAHLLDPGFVELRLSDRAKQYEADLELQLSRRRDEQIRNPDRYAAADRLPTDRAQFVALIVEESRKAAFRQLIQDINQKVLDDPESFRDMRKLLADGKFEDAETGAKVTHPAVKFRALYLRKIGDRYFLENRQDDQAEPKKEPGKEPEKGPGM